MSNNNLVNSAVLNPYGFREEFSPHPINLIRELLTEPKRLFVKFQALLRGLFREIRIQTLI